MNKKYIFYILTFFFITKIYSAEITFEASNNHAPVLSSIHISLNIASGENEKIGNIEIITPDPFLISQTSQSTSTIIINGQMNSNYLYHYIAYSTSPGSFYIKAEIEIIKNNKSSDLIDSINIIITGDSIIVIPTSTNISIKSKIPVLTKANPVQLIMSMSDSTPYTNQQVIAELICYSRLRLTQAPNLLYSPSFSGFWVEILDSLFRYRPIETNHGVIHTYSLKWALFPIQPGIAEIGATEIEIIISQYPLFPKRYSIPSKPIEINVRQLPSEGTPEGFKGSVGNFFIEVTAPDSITTDSAGEIIFIINGNGNLKGIENLKIPKIENVNIFLNESEIIIEDNNDSIVGEKIEKWKINSESPQKLIIPSIKFPYYSPELESYITTASKPCTITIVGDIQGQQSDTIVNIDSLNYIENINHIDFPNIDNLIIKIIYLVLLILLIIGFLKFYISKKIKKNFKYSKAKKHLKNAEKHLNKNNFQEIYRELKQSLEIVLSSDSPMTYSEISEKIQKMLNTEKYIPVLKKWEIIEFSTDFGNLSDKRSNKKDIDITEEIINRIRKIKEKKTNKDELHSPL